MGFGITVIEKQNPPDCRGCVRLYQKDLAKQSKTKAVEGHEQEYK